MQPTPRASVEPAGTPERGPAVTEQFDAIRADLDAIAGLSPEQQVPVYTRIQATLSQALATTGGGEQAAAHPGAPARPGPGRPGGR